MYRVYSAFRIPSSFSGTVGGEKVFPDDLAFGDGMASLTFHANWLRVLAKTRMVRGWDYTDPTSLVKHMPSGSGPELQPPLVVVRVATSPDKFQFVDKLADADFVEGTAEAEEFTTAYHVSVAQDVPGIVLRAAGGLSHALAKGSWTGAEPSKLSPEVAHTTLQATITVEADHHAEAVYPDPAVSAYATAEELLIDVGSEFRVDYLVPDTVIGLDNGDLVTTDGGILRDDRLLLTDIARFAWEWYKSPALLFAGTGQQVEPEWFELGQMITELGTTAATAVGSVIGELVIDIANGTTSITTISDQFELGAL